MLALIRTSGKCRGVFVIISFMLLLGLSSVLVVDASGSSREQALGRLAIHWLEIGQEQYNRGMYSEAKSSLDRAAEHKDYLSSEQRTALNELAEQVRRAASGRDEGLEYLSAGRSYYQAGDYEAALESLEQIGDESHLAGEHRQEYRSLLASIEDAQQQQRAQQERQQAQQQAKQDEQDEPEPAVKTENDAQAQTEQVEADDAVVIEELDVSAETPQPQAEQVRPVVELPDQEPAEQEDSYIDEIRRRQNIIRSHTRAVVNDAVERAERFSSNNNFSEARAALARAEQVVDRNQMDLGRDLYNDYRNRLSSLNGNIARQQEQAQQERTRAQREDAERAQREYVQRMSRERQQRIDELLGNARSYMQQQRFEEALAQVRSVLAIDSLHEDALWLEQRLEDTLMFRETRGIHDRMRSERAKVLRQADEAGIPWSEEVTYPDNWREIIARREPDRAIGHSPETAAIYERLEQVVDLSELHPNMPLREAINIIRNAVDPPLPIVVMWRDLFDNADIDQYTPINMDGLSNIRLQTGLELLLRSISTGFATVGYVVEEGVITIATEDWLPSEMATMVYDVTDLLGEAAHFTSSLRAAQSGGTDAHQRQAGFQDEQQQQQQITAADIQQQRAGRAEQLIELLEETIEPASWEFRGGEGTIRVHDGRSLVVRQTVPNHRRIETLLDSMRVSLGEQVSIEARFLVVGENFLEDIGLDWMLTYKPGGRWGDVDVIPGSFGVARPEITGVPGTLADTTAALTASGAYGRPLDDLQVEFLLRASQAHRDSKSLTAPRVTVLSGENATIRVQQDFGYAYDIDVTTREVGEFGRSTFNINYQTGLVSQGSILNINPTIMPDKRHVLLNITAEQREFLGFRSQTVDVPVFGDAPTAGQDLTVEFPETEVSRVQTRVSVPDGGTLLLGGQRITAEIEREAGVPILSKLPIVSRLFSNRSRVKDYRVLLVLVKPTIILQEEKEAEAIGASR